MSLENNGTSQSGISNTNYTQVTSLVTPERLKETYLFGVEAVDHQGNVLGDDAIQEFINTAVSQLENDLDIAIFPRPIVESKDYYLNDYVNWGYLQLDRYPVISIEEMLLIYTRNNNNLPQTQQEIPQSWIRLDPATGMVRLIPNARFPGNLQVGAAGGFFPEIFGHQAVPNLWSIKYTHGFKEGCIPYALNSAIALLASNFYLIVAGDLVLGSAGIAASSLSIDGLSQSIQSTASAENNGFSARIKDNNRQLFGDRTIGSTGLIESLRRYYKNSSNINII